MSCTTTLIIYVKYFLDNGANRFLAERPLTRDTAKHSSSLQNLYTFFYVIYALNTFICSLIRESNVYVNISSWRFTAFSYLGMSFIGLATTNTRRIFRTEYYSSLFSSNVRLFVLLHFTTFSCLRCTSRSTSSRAALSWKGCHFRQKNLLRTSNRTAFYTNLLINCQSLLANCYRAFKTAYGHTYNCLTAT